MLDYIIEEVFMDIIQLKCENCGATLNIEKDAKQYICQHCGTQFVLKNVENSDKSSIDIMLENVIDAERTGNYQEAIRAYDRAMELAPQRPEVIIGKAFASLSELSLGVVNVQYFKTIFYKAISLIAEDKKYYYHEFILDKSWSIMPYLIKLVMQNYSEPVVYVENLLYIFDILITVSNVIDEDVLLDPVQRVSMKAYIDGYVELKNTIIAQGKYTLKTARKLSVGMLAESKKNIKISVKTAKKQIKKFRKIYAI